MAPLFKHTTEDRIISVSGAEAEARYEADDNWQLTEPEPERAYPEGKPTPQWTVDELKRWASEHDVDVPAGAKPVVVEAVLAALAAMETPTGNPPVAGSTTLAQVSSKAAENTPPVE